MGTIITIGVANRTELLKGDGMLSVLLYIFGGLITIYGFFCMGKIIYFAFFQGNAEFDWMVILLHPISRELREAVAVIAIGLVLLAIRRIIRILDE